MEERVQRKIETAERKIIKLKELELDKYKHNKDIHLKTFLKDLFENLIVVNKTIYKDNKKTATGVNKCRSISEIFRVVRNYYPEASLKDVLEGMAKIKKLKAHYCPDVHKQVYFYRGNRYNSFSKLYIPVEDEHEIELQPIFKDSEGYHEKVEYYPHRAYLKERRASKAYVYNF